AQAQPLRVRRRVAGLARAVDGDGLLHLLAVGFEQPLDLLRDLEEQLLGAQLLVLLLLFGELAHGLAHLALGVLLGALRVLEVAFLERVLRLPCARSRLVEARGRLGRVALLVAARELEELVPDTLLLLRELLRLLAILGALRIRALARALG